MANPFSSMPSSDAPAAAPAKRKTLTTKPGFNAKPDKDANAGAMPNMMGDVTKNPKPDVPMIAPSTAGARAAGGSPSPQGGLDAAMGALADKIHPRSR